MHFNVDDRTILLVRHGSHAYGLNIETSDEDFKGICIKPKACYLGFTQRFEQHEKMSSKNEGVDSVVYSLDKFAALAADCNPNIIEVLHCDEGDVIKIDGFGEQLRGIAHDFISKKARFTFSGYAHAQLKRIKTHRSWLLDPPTTPPSRASYGLSEGMKVSQSELGALEASINSGIEIEMPKDVMVLFTREKQYQADKTRWDQFQNWKKSRNPARAELEEKYGYDTKHGMHLLRLMRMCKEILSTGKVVVKRPDRDELLAVRSGQVSYDALIDEAERLDAECDALYKTSTLRKEPDRVHLDGVVVDMTERYLRLYG
jgi:predicted nucleotidyltransferase